MVMMRSFLKVECSLLLALAVIQSSITFQVTKVIQRCKITDGRHCWHKAIIQLKLQQNAVINAQDITIPIIYEDNNLLAISKPSFVPHHDDPQSGQMGILSIIRQQQSDELFPYTSRLYGVHRLDRVTSGILLLAKDSSTANELITKFRRKEVQKYYFAVSAKKPKKKKQGWVKGRMVMGRRGSYKLVNENKSTIQHDNEDDEGVENTSKNEVGYAETRFYTAGLGNLDLGLVPNENINEDASSNHIVVPKTAILFEPHTGKTHQLRVAAKSVGLPILGDERYGGGKVNISREETTKIEEKADPSVFDRTYLHASAIHFIMDAGYNVTICSSPPFGHLFRDESSFNDVFVKMMDKYCDCLPVLDAIHKS
jgi:tRNA pseudouridine32 synthase/23S rRNA pseudouridine746 synthase